jgi:hypothetical protein
VDIVWNQGHRIRQELGLIRGNLSIRGVGGPPILATRLGMFDTQGFGALTSPRTQVLEDSSTVRSGRIRVGQMHAVPLL